MYALIYDDHKGPGEQIRVISVHGTREASERALSRRQIELGRRVWECNTRIVWTDKAVDAGETLGRKEFIIWRSDENVPEGELYSDAD